MVLPKFRKEAAPEKPETIKVEAAEKSYAAGSRISEKNFRVYGISGKKKQLLDADTPSRTGDSRHNTLQQRSPGPQRTAGSELHGR